MTQTLEAQAGLTPQQRIDAWLADFEAALAARDIDRVVGKFATDSFWRDLVAFTWNIKTVEGRDQIADMLTARLADTDPSGFRTREAPTVDGDVTSAFIEFDIHTSKDGASKLKIELSLPATARACVQTVVTELGVFDCKGDHFHCRELAPQVTRDQVQASTEAPVTFD